MSRSVRPSRPVRPNARCRICQRLISTMAAFTRDPSTASSLSGASPDLDFSVVYKVNICNPYYVHHACLLYHEQHLDIASLQEEAKINAIQRLVTGARSTKACQGLCGGRQRANLKCHQEQCHQWFHLPCIPAGNIKHTDAKNNTIIFFCDKHLLQHEQELKEQLSTSSSSSSSSTPTNVASSMTYPANTTAKNAESDTDSQMTVRESVDEMDLVRDAAPSLSGSSSTAARTQQLLKDLVAIISDCPVGNLSLSYMQQIPEDMINRIQNTIAVLYGINGVGKTWIINLLLFLTAPAQEDYAEQAATAMRGFLRAVADPVAAELFMKLTQSIHKAAPKTSRHSHADTQQRSTTSTLRSPIISESSASTSFGGATVAGWSFSQLLKDPLFRGLDLHKYSTIPGMPETGDSVIAGAEEFPCFSLNETGYAHYSSTDYVKQRYSTWEAPLKLSSISPIKEKEITPWLLKSADVGLSTTAHIFRLVYSPVWHATIHFMTVELAQQACYNYISAMIEVASQQIQRNVNELKLAKAHYDHLVQQPLSVFNWKGYSPKLTDKQISDMLNDDTLLTDHSLLASYSQLREIAAGTLPVPLSSSQVPLSAHIQPLLVKKKLIFKGTGQDLTADRAFLQSQIDYWTSCHDSRYAILFCSIYSPCAVLDGVELWDIPGLDDTDPTKQWLQREALDEADITICILPRAVSSCQTVIQGLKDSEILQRRILGQDELGHVAFLHYDERARRYDYPTFLAELKAGREETPIDTADSSTSSNTSMSVSNRNVINHTRGEILSLLEQAERDAVDDTADARSSLEIEQLMNQRVTIRCIYPVMFTSLLLNDPRNNEPDPDRKVVMDDGDRQMVVDATGGYDLCGLLRSCVPSLCNQLLSRFIGERNEDGQHVITARQQRRAAEDEQHDVSPSTSDTDTDEDGDDRDIEMDGESELGNVTHNDSNGLCNGNSNHNGAAYGNGNTNAESDSGDITTDDDDGDDSSSAPASPHPSRDSLIRLSSRLDTPISFAFDSHLYSLATHIARFADQYLGNNSEESKSVYETIRKQSIAQYARLLKQLQKKPSHRWGLDEERRVVFLKKAERCQKGWVDKLTAATRGFQAHLDGEVTIAIETAQKQWLQASSRVTVNHLDPKRHGLVKPVELRRIIFGHFSEMARLHITDLHRVLKVTWEDIFKECKAQVFEPGLILMFTPQVSGTAEFKDTMERVTDYTLREPFIVEWEEYLTGGNRAIAGKADMGLNHQRLYNHMQQLCRYHLHNWLESNWSTWKAMFRKKNVRKNVIQEIKDEIPTLIVETMNEFKAELILRVEKNLDHFLDNCFWRKRMRDGKAQLAIFDNAIVQFLDELQNFDEDTTTDALAESLKTLIVQLQQWEINALRLCRQIEHIDSASLGKELVVSVYRNKAYSELIAQSGFTEETKKLIIDAQKRKEHNVSSKVLTGQYRAVEAGDLVDQWLKLQRDCSSSSSSVSFSQRCQLLNAKLKHSRQHLWISREDSSAEPTFKSDMLYRSVAIALITGGDEDRMKELEVDQLNMLIETLKARVYRALGKVSADSASGESIQAFYRCDLKELVHRLQAGNEFSSPYILSLLATSLRLHMVIWTVENAQKGEKVNLLRHDYRLPSNRHTRHTSIPDVYLHLAFIPTPVASSPSSSSSSSSAVIDHPFCILPLFIRLPSVHYDEEAEVKEFEVDGTDKKMKSTRHLVNNERLQRQQKQRPVDVHAPFTPQVSIKRSSPHPMANTSLSSSLSPSSVSSSSPFSPSSPSSFYPSSRPPSLALVHQLGVPAAKRVKR